MLVSQQSLTTDHSYLEHECLGGPSEISSEQTSGFMPHGGARGQYLGNLVKCSIAVFKFFLCLYLSSQFSTSVHIRNMGAWKGCLSVSRYQPLCSCPRVGLGFKIQDISFKVFSAFLLC